MYSFSNQRPPLYPTTNGGTSLLPLNLHQRSSSSLPTPLPAITRHKMFAFMTPTFLAFVQIKFENEDHTPFDTHPIAINASILNFLIYCISSIAESMLLKHAIDSAYVLVFMHISDLSAALVVTLLSSIIFSVPLRWFTYIAYMFLLVRTFFNLLCCLKLWIFKKTKKAVQFALEFIYTTMTRSSARYLGLQHRDPTLSPV